MKSFLSPCAAVCCSHTEVEVCETSASGHKSELNHAEISKSLRRLGMDPTEDILDSIGQMGRGINLTEFTEWLSSKRGANSILPEVFHLIDVDGNGKISTAELKYLLDELKINVLSGEIEQAMQLADKDGDGTVDFKEFSKSKGLWSQVKLMLLARAFNVQVEFDGLSLEYDQLIRVWIPWYEEMLTVTVEALPPNPVAPVMVELGCGTGNLSAALLRAFPGATLHSVDNSPQSLDLCRNRFKEQEVVYHEKDFMDLDFAAASVDHVVSTVSLHHLEETLRKALFARSFKWLNPGGSLCYTDIFRGGDQEENERFYKEWKDASYALGATDEQWGRFMEHDRKHDKHSSMAVVTGWLRKIGFVDIQVTWSRSLWANVVARKP